MHTERYRRYLERNKRKDKGRYYKTQKKDNPVELRKKRVVQQRMERQKKRVKKNIERSEERKNQQGRLCEKKESIQGIV